jgi:hypothetical protein
VTRLKHLKWAKLSAALVVALSLTACQQRMAKQPAYRPLTTTDFYSDGRSSRPLEEGVVHRNQILDSDPLASGLSTAGKQPQTVEYLDAEGKKTVTKTSPGIPNKTENFVNEFPFQLTSEDLQRGKQRYTIYCTPCHGTMGDGKGKIWERGFFLSNTSLTVPNYHNENSRGFGFYNQKIALRDVPVGYIYEVISKGFGGMPDHASQINVADRWRIAAYIKALMLSQHASTQDGALKLTPEQWAEIEKALGGKK